MKEEFLHFVWQNLYFSQENLQNTLGESLKIVDTGKYNPNEGADFENAIILINGKSYKGHVEIHLKSSDWLKHKHEQNPKYQNIILHVVWENDIAPTNNMPTCVLELKGRVNSTLLQNYKRLITNRNFVPCSNLLANVENIFVLATWDKVLVERLERKSEKVRRLWLATQQDWQETTYRLLAESFGFKINALAFQKLSWQTPLKIFLKHQDNLLQIEAILFGQAGLLHENFQDEYAQTLQKEYRFLQHKYNLQPIQTQEWNFLRLRPANFPTIRLAQFAQILHKNHNLFSSLLYAEDLAALQKVFEIKVSDYWQKHYHFGKASKRLNYRLGESSFHGLVINTIVPLHFCYGKLYQKPEYIDKAISFLEQLPVEENHIVEEWKKLGMHPCSAADSQALLELYHNFCTPKRCLSCTIGNTILHKNSSSNHS